MSFGVCVWGGCLCPTHPTPLPRGGISPSLQEKRKRHQNKRTERTDDGTSLKNFPCKRFKEVGRGQERGGGGRNKAGGWGDTGHSPLTPLLSHRETAPWVLSAVTRTKGGPRPPPRPDVASRPH